MHEIQSFLDQALGLGQETPALQEIILALGLSFLLNLIIAAIIGVSVPLVLHRLDRDPAQGSSVMLTFVTDSMGFFLFLGLANAFLL